MKYLSVTAALLCTVIVFGVLPCMAESAELKKVFIVHSYSFDNICGMPQHTGVVEVLEKSGFIPEENIEIYTWAMDTKLTNNTPELIRKEAELVIQRVDEVVPDVLVVLDDNAFRTVGLHYFDSQLPVVFSGMNGLPDDYNKIKPWMDSRIRPGHNITGVYEKLHVVVALKVEKRFIPGFEKVVMIVDTSPTGKAVLKQVNLELSEADPGVEFEKRVAHSWEEYIKIIREICADPEVDGIYPVAVMLKDGSGKSYSGGEIVRWTVDNCSKPGIPVNYSLAKLGLLGGAGVDFISMGRQAGTMVAKVLRGESPADIPVEDAKRYALVFNLKRARDLGIKIPNDILMAADEVYK